MYWHEGSAAWLEGDAKDGEGRHGCGCSSAVEHDLAKVGVEGSNPFARSKIIVNGMKDSVDKAPATGSYRYIESATSQDGAANGVRLKSLRRLQVSGRGNGARQGAAGSWDRGFQ